MVPRWRDDSAGGTDDAAEPPGGPGRPRKQAPEAEAMLRRPNRVTRPSDTPRNVRRQPDMGAAGQPTPESLSVRYVPSAIRASPSATSRSRSPLLPPAYRPSVTNLRER